MKAGIEFDMLVAEKVMGWTAKKITDETEWFYIIWFDGDKEIGVLPPRFSTDIGDAFKVVEKLRNEMILPTIFPYAIEWSITIDDVEIQHWELPYAICLVALKAKGIKADWIDKYIVPKETSK